MSTSAPTSPAEWATSLGAPISDRSAANASALSDDALVDRLMVLERLWAWAGAGTFTWNGTDADTIERAAILTECATRGL